jgi:hypothetical protein
MTAALVKSVSIDNLLNQRAAVLDRLAAVRVALLEIDALAAAIEAEAPRRSFYWSASGALVNSRGDAYKLRITSDDGIAAATVEFDRMAWRHLMHASGLRSLMDATAREKWEKSLDGGDFPPLTRENIEATFARLYDARGDMFERGVIEVFRRLSWCYKTNLPHKFGKRIILTGITGTYGNRSCDYLDDLVRVLHVLDGKPEPDHRQGTYAVLSAAGLTYQDRRGVAETEYYSIRTFKNFSGHVTFKRLDLIEQMNRIIARHYPGALPPPTRSA